MNPFLTASVLVGLAASLTMCQETTVSPALPATQPTGHSILRKLLKSSDSETLVPLTQQERFRLYLAGTYGPGSTFSAATVGGFEQLLNTPSEWKQGFEGYKKRFLSAYATHIVQGSIEYGASALLHEDNRYRPSLETGVWRRSKHAILSAFSSTDNAGHQHFSYSRVGAAGATAFIRRTWQPDSTAGINDAVSTIGITLSARVAGNVFKEFRPDLNRHIFRSK